MDAIWTYNVATEELSITLVPSPSLDVIWTAAYHICQTLYENGKASSEAKIIFKERVSTATIHAAEPLDAGIILLTSAYGESGAS